MDRLIDILLGLLLGWCVARLWSETFKGAGETLPLTSPRAAAPIEPETLTGRLHKLESGISSFTSSAAHPREQLDQRDFKDAVSLLADPDTPIEIVEQYALGANFGLSMAALTALAERSDGGNAMRPLIAQFENLAPWAMYFAFRYLESQDERPRPGDLVIGARDWWRDNNLMPQLFRDYFDTCVARNEEARFSDEARARPNRDNAAIKAFLASLRHPFAEALQREAETLPATATAPAEAGFLESFGRFWPSQDGKVVRIEPEVWREALDAAAGTFSKGRNRSILVAGDASVGKSTFLRLLAERAIAKGWRVFEASGADLMAGQQWFGQLEERIRRTLEEASAAKSIIWYIPDLLALARSGTHQGQSASILDQIMPAVAAGRVVIWTEASPTSAARLYQSRPTLRSLTEVIALEAMDEEETAELAIKVSSQLARVHHVTIEDDCVPMALASARQYMSSSSLPGAVLSLLKLSVLRGEKGKATRITADRVLETLSQMTGLPVSILDHHGRIDLAEIRDFFGARVMGQPEAVSAIVERIAMLKAGLSDPGKPIGVFLFAGPTGTGKTELAKTTAEYLFSSDDRMLRLDMSEFQTAESQGKIVGETNQNPSYETDSLVARVRKQPFSVVLLDEFEKAHPRIWDLFLQVFDEGRLSDAAGHVADFRHCIIILTTNLGATTHQNSGLGFAPAASQFSNDQVLRAIQQTYRPEFINRLDKVIVFRPLTRDLMRSILKKELDHVLDRRGLRHRAWAVEWESSAIEFLLEKGFSPEMGARPLKRAIDQYVLSPLAGTIVERRFPEGDQFVFVRSDGRAIQAEFVDPDADAPAKAKPARGGVNGKAPAIASMIMSAEGTSSEFEALRERVDAIDVRLASPDWEKLKLEFAAAMSDAGFWRDASRHTTLSRYALMDRVTAAAGTARSLLERLDKAGGATKFSRELVSRLALQVHVVEHGLRDVFEASPVEVALVIEPALEGANEAAAERWCSELLAMYRGWSTNRNMQLQEMTSSARGASSILLVSGFGAHRTLAGDVGLHVLERGGGEQATSRIAARVILLEPPLGDVPPARMQTILEKSLAEAARSSTVVRRYRREPSPLVRNFDGSWRTGRIDEVLAGDFDLLALEASRD